MDATRALPSPLAFSTSSDMAKTSKLRSSSPKPQHNKSVRLILRNRVAEIWTIPVGLLAEARRSRHIQEENPYYQRSALKCEAEATSYNRHLALHGKEDGVTAAGYPKPLQLRSALGEQAHSASNLDFVDRGRSRIVKDEAFGGENTFPTGDLEQRSNDVRLITSFDKPSPPRKFALSTPIVVPQRRPGTKTRGFQRAYPPVLEEVGIDEDAFLAILDEVNHASRGSRILSIMTQATGIASFYPEILIALLFSVVFGIAWLGQSMESQYRVKKSLNKLNEEIFILRDKLIMIAKFDNDRDDGVLRVQANRKLALDLSNTAEGLRAQPNEASSKSSKSNRISELKSKISGPIPHLTRDTWYEYDQLPSSYTPLVFQASTAPSKTGLDSSTKRDKNSHHLWGRTKGKLDRATAFVNKYLDHRAQAKFVSLSWGADAASCVMNCLYFPVIGRRSSS